MRLNILIDKTGVFLNPGQNNLINASPIDGDAGSTLLNNQITLCFYDEIEQLTNGQYVPIKSSVVKTGLSGIVSFKAFPADDAPYSVAINPSGSIDISNSCILLISGIIEALDVTCTGVTGANYINILVDRV